MSATAMDTARPAKLNLRIWFYTGLLAALALLPPVAAAFGRGDLISQFSLVMTFAMAAVSLNLILGYGGMISFGHAAFLAIGGYTVGICSYYGIDAAIIQWPLALVFSAVFAAITGAICLRTRGVYFIMITLAFAQMLFFGFVSIEEYGGDDGLTVNSRSDLGGLVDLENDKVLYYVIFAFLLATVYLVHRVVNSRFGWVIRGARSNDARMQALGYPTYVYRLAAYVIAGVICGMAGVLFANYANFVNPEDTAWTRSGDLIFMVVLGGMGTLFGPVLGAILFHLIEELIGALPVVGIYWKVFFGPFLVLVVLYARGGIDSWLEVHPLPDGAGSARFTIAGPGRRLLAAGIDLVALGLLALFAFLVLGPWLMTLPEAEHRQALMMVLCIYAVLAVAMVNHLVLPRSSHRGSLGKIAMGLQVVSADGEAMSRQQTVQRVFGQMLSVATGLIGYLWFIRDDKSRALHDRMAATRVILARRGA